MNIQETTKEAFLQWRDRHAESTVRCQGIYFNALLKTAKKNGIDMPSQELYDDFIKGADTPAVRFCKMQVVKAVDVIAETHAVTPKGVFYNEPPFPTKNETQAVIAAMCYPISQPVDISHLIVYGAAEIANHGASPGGMGQYWHSWSDIRTYSFLQNKTMDYDQEVLVQYLAELDMKYNSGSIPQTSYYMHRKAALIIIEIAETGQHKWKRTLREPIRSLEDSDLEDIRQQHLLFLKENNYAESTIRTRDYVFRNMIKFSGIHSAGRLFHLSTSDVGNILKGFASRYQNIDSPVTIIRMILKYLYEHGLLEENRSGMVMAPFHHHGSPPCYIPEKEDEKFHEALKHITKRNRAIILLARKLGLRTGDICDLTFSQIDWQEDKIRLNQNKTGEHIVLPLLPEVGNAIFEYIQKERPKREDGYPYIFLRSQAPFIKLVRLYGISDRFIKHSDIERINGTQRGMHLYRRTLTNRLLIEEVPHHVITDTLGHTSKETDKPYISMEEYMLRQCALELGPIGIKNWEGGDRDEGTCIPE